jgi:hypothetical protein
LIVDFKKLLVCVDVDDGTECMYRESRRRSLERVEARRNKTNTRNKGEAVVFIPATSREPTPICFTPRRAANCKTN